MEPTELKITLRAIVYREADWWIAHCLETDLVAEGGTRADALRNLDDLCRLQLETALKQGDLDSFFQPAPAEIWRMFALGVERRMPRKPARPIERFEARELALA